MPQGLVEELSSFAVALVDRAPGELQRHQGVNEALLRSVVEVAFEAAAGFVAGGDDPSAGSAQLGVARLEGVGHRVEGALECPDLGDPRLGQARAQVALGEPPGRLGRATYGERDRAQAVDAAEQSEDDRSGQRHGGEHHCPLCVVIRRLLAVCEHLAVRRDQLVELGAKRVDPILPLLSRGDPARARIAPARRAHEGDRVVADIGPPGCDEALRPSHPLGRVRQLDQRPALARE
jgi:hypothetical protein